MLEHADQFSITRMASVLNASRSGYYTKDVPGPMIVARAMRDEKVKEAFDQSKQRDGVVRIQVELEDNGDKHDVIMIRDSMKRQRLISKAARKFKVTTDSNHHKPVAPNLLEQDCEAEAPNQKWAGVLPTYEPPKAGSIWLSLLISIHALLSAGQ